MPNIELISQTVSSVKVRARQIRSDRVERTHSFTLSMFYTNTVIHTLAARGKGTNKTNESINSAYICVQYDNNRLSIKLSGQLLVFCKMLKLNQGHTTQRNKLLEINLVACLHFSAWLLVCTFLSGCLFALSYKSLQSSSQDLHIRKLCSTSNLNFPLDTRMVEILHRLRFPIAKRNHLYRVTTRPSSQWEITYIATSYFLTIFAPTSKKAEMAMFQNLIYEWA